MKFDTYDHGSLGKREAIELSVDDIEVIVRGYLSGMGLADFALKCRFCVLQDSDDMYTTRVVCDRILP